MIGQFLTYSIALWKYFLKWYISRLGKTAELIMVTITSHVFYLHLPNGMLFSYNIQNQLREKHKHSFDAKSCILVPLKCSPSLGTSLFVMKWPYRILCLTLRDWSIFDIFYCIMEIFPEMVYFPIRKNCRTDYGYHNQSRVLFASSERNAFQL